MCVWVGGRGIRERDVGVWFGGRGVRERGLGWR